MKYGLPYQGSKNKLAKRIVDLLPPAAHFYDLFAGGCAVTHAALLSGKFGKVHFSDTNDSVVLFRDCLEGNVPDGSEWISREEFYRRRDSDPYVRLVWSFGNNQKNYLYSKEIEPYKKAVHEMIFAKTPNERRLKFREVCKLMPSVIGGGCKTSRPRDNGTLPEVIYRLQSAEYTPPRKCYDMQSGEAGNRIWEFRRQKLNGGMLTPFCFGEYEMKVADYRNIEILPDSTIYCDIPYWNTMGYGENIFDHEAFYDWCEKQTQPLFISEYWMPEDRFECVAEFERTSTFSATNNSLKMIERIYRPKHQLR